MNWLNLNIQTLDSENFLGSDPIDRATWLCLLRYCIGQENSGVIAGCKTWADRKWQQLVRVTKKESDRHCGLWEWDGDNLVVWGYPDEKEYEVQQLRGIGRQTSEAKRAAAKANGLKGGRPKTTQEQNPPETHEEPKITQRKPIERKGSRKEREGEGKNPTEHTPGASATPPEENIPDKWSDSMTTETARDFGKLEAWINSLHPSWKARPHFSRIEREELLANAKIFFDLTDKDKSLLAAYLDAAIPGEWGKFWQPDQRGQLVRSVMDILGHADRWERECRKRKIAVQFKPNAAVDARRESTNHQHDG